MKLIFVDIDGTLTEAGSNVPPQVPWMLLRQHRQRVIKFSYVQVVILQCFHHYSNMVLMVLLQVVGGYVTIGGEVIYDHPMTKEQTELALDVLKRNGVFRTIRSKGCYIW